jgi:hypothetical protein
MRGLGTSGHHTKQRRKRFRADRFILLALYCIKLFDGFLDISTILVQPLRLAP